ncbi:MAG: hypothetical protein AAB455_02500, partial [Patescibacteria group bacterium]
MSHDHSLADEIDFVTAEGYAMATKTCPYEGCGGEINLATQAVVTGGGTFICPKCDGKAFL